MSDEPVWVEMSFAEAVSGVLKEIREVVEVATRAGALMAQVMKTWDPPYSSEDERRADIAQTAVMITIAYIMGREFLPCDLTENQQAAIDSGLRLLDRELEHQPTLTEWMERWESEVERGHSGISREEAERRYYATYGRERDSRGEG